MSRVFNPETVIEVREIVRDSHRAGRHLKVVSTDRNWGYRFPERLADDTDLLSLGRLARIRNLDRISATHPVALIEPGVTQGQMADALADRQLPLFVNVTGSARDTSIIGNALDGGIGYFGSRRDDLFGFEVVLPDGEMLHTGMRSTDDAGPLALLQKYGPGPSLDGLFYQSRAGIVVSACTHLKVRPPVQVALSINLRPGRSFVRFVDGLAQLRRSDVLTGVIHVGNRARTHSTLLPGLRRHLQALGVQAEHLASEAQATLGLLKTEEWSALVGVGGTQRQVDAVVHEVQRVVGAEARVRVVSSARLRFAKALTGWLTSVPGGRRAQALLRTLEPLHGLAVGTPTDEAVRSLLDGAGEVTTAVRDLDSSRVGLIYLSPIMPLDGTVIDRTLAMMRATADRHGFSPYVTVNIESRLTAIAVTNVLFDRADLPAQGLAERCVDEMYLNLTAIGLEVYRAHTHTAKLMRQNAEQRSLAKSATGPLNGAR